MWRIVAVILVLSSPALADVVGSPRVVDGDSLAFGSERVRIHGIDAPERGQSCDGVAIGREASAYLRSLITGPVRCVGSDRDRYGRLIAVCYSGGRDLGAEMVRAGKAWAYLRYSDDYRALQVATGCTPPWVWRRR